MAKAHRPGVRFCAGMKEFSSPPLPTPKADFARHAKRHAGLFFLGASARLHLSHLSHVSYLPHVAMWLERSHLDWTRQGRGDLPAEQGARMVRRDMASHGKEAQRRAAGKAPGIDGTVKVKALYMDAMSSCATSRKPGYQTDLP
jgi:hypothetical protein